MIATALADSKSFDALLVVHAIVAIASFVVLLTLRAAAVAAARGGELPAYAQRTFTAHREVAGRTVHLLPVTGIGLVAISHGTYELYSPFVIVGLCAWAVCAALLEGVAFPAQRELAAREASGDAAQPIAAATATATATRMVRAIEIALLAIAVTAVVMVATPAVR